MSFTKKLPTLLQNGANLAPPFCCSSSCFVDPLHVLFFFHASWFFLLRCLFFYFVVIFHALLLLLLRYSFLCFGALALILLLFLFCYSSSYFIAPQCFTTPPILMFLCASLLLLFHCFNSYFAWLLPIVLNYYFVLCFTIAPTLVLFHVSLLLMFRCCSYFATLVVSLLSCPPRYLSAPCCFTTPCFIIVQCFSASLFRLVLPPRLFFQGVKNLNLELIGKKLENIQAPSCNKFFLFFFFSKLFFDPSLIWF